MDIKRRLIIEEIARRKSLKAIPAYDYSKFAHEYQKKLLNDDSRYIAFWAGRRGGKTNAIILKMKKIASEHPGEKQVYIAKTRKYAKSIIWNEIKKFLKDTGEKVLTNETDLSITFIDNNSTIIIGGCKDENEVSKFRGLFYKWVYIDEAQDIKKSLMTILINEVITPALIDVNGGLWMCGTPHPSCAGAFFEACHNKGNFRGYKNYNWNLFDNPFLLKKSGKTGDEIIDEVCKQRGVDKDDPAIQREFFGRWIKSTESIVYKYEPAVNDFVTLPEGYHWQYVLGVDIGYDDADALVVLAYSEDLPDIYVVEEFKKSKQDITDLAKRIKELNIKYSFTRQVIDSGALGKKITEELRLRHQLNLDAADKSQKWAFIKLMNDDFRKGRIKIDAINCPFLADEWATLLKSEDGEEKIKEDKRFDNHLADAALYAWREAYHFTYKEKPKEPEVGSNEWLAKQASQIEQDLINKLNSPDKEWWESDGQ